MRGTLLVVGIALALVVGLWPTVGSAQGETPAANTLARCVQTRGALNVVFLIDESGSLATTDPEDRRVEGIRAALAGLGRLATADGIETTPEIEVMLVGFSHGVIPDPESEDTADHWQRLTKTSAGRVIDEAGRFAHRDTNHETNYEAALIGARRILAQRVGERTADGGVSPCKAIVWFTDGRYEVDGGQAAVNRGMQNLCQPGGVMDGLVEDGVVKFVVGLSLNRSGRDLLQELADGNGLGSHCGTRLGPSTGAYFDVRESGELFFTFGELIEEGGRRLPPRKVCELKPCREGQYMFTTVAGLRGFLIRATTGGGRIQVALDGPDGSTVLSPAHDFEGEVSGARLTSRWASGSAVEIEAALPPGASPTWIGNWSFAFVDPSGEETSAVPDPRVQLFAGLVPTLSGEPELARGARTHLELRLGTAAETSPPAGPLLRSAQLEAGLTIPETSSPASPPVTTSPGTEPGAFMVTTEVPREQSSPLVVLDTVTRFAPISGVGVVPVRRSFELKTRLPVREGFPTVSPSELRPPSIEGKGSTTATFTVTASPDSNGCVWIDPVRSARLDLDVSPTARTAKTCLAVPRGTSKQFTVTFGARREYSGTARLDIPVRLTSELGGGARTVAIPASVELYQTPNVGERILIVLGLTALGVLLPLLGLWALNYWGARLAAPQLLRKLEQKVVLGPDSELRSADGRPLRARYKEFETLRTEGLPRRVRALRLGEGAIPFRVDAVAARRLGDLFRGPYAVASAGGEPIFVGSTAGTLRASGDEAKHEVPLALSGVWMFTTTDVRIAEQGNVDTGRVVVEGSLLMVIADGADVDEGAKLLTDARTRLEQHDWHHHAHGSGRASSAEINAASDPLQESGDAVDSPYEY